MKFGFVQTAGAIAALALLLSAQLSIQAQGPAEVSENGAFSFPQAQLIQPEELSRLLLAGGNDKPLVLQVGSRVLFSQAHITGSEYVGPGSQPDGLKQLQKRVGALSRAASIVLYCGCCPWNRCPNVGSAFKLLHDMGFTRVKVLYVANNLGTDWDDKGYPVERTH